MKDSMQQGGGGNGYKQFFQVCYHKGPEALQ